MGIDKPNIHVIIPTVQYDLLGGLLASMERNTLLPYSVLVIDNGKEGFHYDGPLPVVVYRPAKPLYVNPAWNYGLDHIPAECGFVSILNDDLLLENQFFERTINTFRQTRKCCGVSAATTKEQSELRKDASDRPVNIIRMHRMYGWAFTMPLTFVSLVPRIPKIFNTFCGDQWFWYWGRYFRYKWCLDEGNLVWHKVGVSVRQLGFKKTVKPEKDRFKNFVKDMFFTEDGHTFLRHHEEIELL